MGSFKRDRPVSAFSRVSATSDRIAVYDNSCRPFLLANFVHPSTCNLSTYVPRVTLRGAPVVVVLSRLMQRVEGGDSWRAHASLQNTRVAFIEYQYRRHVGLLLLLSSSIQTINKEKTAARRVSIGEHNTKYIITHSRPNEYCYYFPPQTNRYTLLLNVTPIK